MLYCKKCGAPVGENDMFCTSCSTRLDSSSVVNKAGLSSIAAEKSEFSPDSLVTETDLTGCCIMDMRLTEKLFSLMGADYYRAVKANGEKCIPLMIRHIVFPGNTDRDCALLNNGGDSSDAGALAQRFTQTLARECASFSAACAAAGIPSLNYRTEVMFSPLYDVYHVFILMNHAVPLPLFLRNEEITVRDAIQIGAAISSQLLELEKKRFHYGAFSDLTVFVSGDNSGRRIFLDCRMAVCYQSFLPMCSYMSYFRQYVSPRRRNYEVYSLGTILYRFLCKGRHPYLRNRGVITADKFMEAERLRSMMAEPCPPDHLQNTLGTVIHDAISNSAHELTLSEFSRILANSFNYVQAGELNKII